MSEAKHTPGPWVAKRRGSGRWFVNAPGADADVAGVVHWSDIQDAADARLIAAAPDLLTVVRAVLLFHRGGHWSPDRAAEWERTLHPLLGDEPFGATTKTLCDAARAAIAKATGGEP